MYIPSIKDVFVSGWREYDGQLVNHCVIYLAGAENLKLEDNSFGHRQTACVPLDASARQKENALREAASLCVTTFDVLKAAREQDYAHELEDLRPIDLSGFTPYAEVN